MYGMIVALSLAAAPPVQPIQMRYGDGTDPFQPFTSPQSRAQEMLRERGYNPYPFQNLPTANPADGYEMARRTQEEFEARKAANRARLCQQHGGASCY